MFKHLLCGVSMAAFVLVAPGSALASSGPTLSLTCGDSIAGTYVLENLRGARTVTVFVDNVCDGPTLLEIFDSRGNSVSEMEAVPGAKMAVSARVNSNWRIEVRAGGTTGSAGVTINVDR